MLQEAATTRSLHVTGSFRWLLLEYVAVYSTGDEQPARESLVLRILRTAGRTLLFHVWPVQEAHVAAIIGRVMSRIRCGRRWQPTPRPANRHMIVICCAVALLLFRESLGVQEAPAWPDLVYQAVMLSYAASSSARVAHSQCAQGWIGWYCRVVLQCAIHSIAPSLHCSQVVTVTKTLSSSLLSSSLLSPLHLHRNRPPAPPSSSHGQRSQRGSPEQTV